MKRLTIHLKVAEKTGNKIFNTVSFIVRSERDINSKIALYGSDNIKKSYVTNLI